MGGFIMERMLRLLAIIALALGLVACDSDLLDRDTEDSPNKVDEVGKVSDTEVSEEIISFTDEKLEAAIRETLKKDDGDLTADDVEGVTELHLSGIDIEDLSGIEVFVQLEKLFMTHNQISDLLPLEALENLQELHIYENPAVDSSDQGAVIDSLIDRGVNVVTSIPKIESGKGGFLWRVEDGDTTVYLQGTVHLGTEDFYPFHDLIEEAYESADIVVPEVDVTDVDLFSSLGATAMHGVYFDGTTIKDHISEEIYEKLEEVLETYGMPVDIVGFFKPWMLSMTLNQLVAQELGFMHGVDMYFLERAKEDGKEIIELESVDDQYDVLAGRSPEFQEQQLEETLDSMDDFENVMMEVFALYLDGNSDALLQLLFPPDDAEVDEEYEEYMKDLNDRRNVTMAEKIKEFLEEDSDKTYFVFVGAAHLIKEPHIISILEEEGYTIDHVY